MAAASTLRTPADPQALLARYTEYFRARLRATTRTTRLLATLALILSIASGGYGLRRYLRKRAAEKSRRQRLLRRNSGLRGQDGSRTIFVPYHDSTAKVVIYPTKQTTFDAHKRLFLSPPRASGLSRADALQAPPPQTKPGLNLAFLHQFLSLMSIMIPHWNSKESGLLLSQGLFLLLRTYLSLVVARLDGVIVRDLVAGNGKAFLWGIVRWCGIGGTLFPAK
jgi:ATP-binding cassette, subfamily D (ALD), peroxisomal long-chain fatty acid import protein